MWDYSERICGLCGGYVVELPCGEPVPFGDACYCGGYELGSSEFPELGIDPEW